MKKLSFIFILLLAMVANATIGLIEGIDPLEYNGHVYYWVSDGFKEGLTWDEAHEFMTDDFSYEGQQSEDSVYLFVPGDSLENYSVYNQVPSLLPNWNLNVWLGLYDNGDTWVCDYSGLEPDWVNWGYTWPSSPYGDYAVLQISGANEVYTTVGNWYNRGFQNSNIPIAIIEVAPYIETSLARITWAEIKTNFN